MSLDVADAHVSRLLLRLHPYARALVQRAGAQALRLHADRVTPEHLLITLMADPDCAACAAVLHAFADPSTIGSEALAIAPGIMVVASDSTRPFSTRGLEALVRAREAAAAIGAATVDERRLLLEAVSVLDVDLQESLRTAGLSLEPLRSCADLRTEPPLILEDPFFKHFSLRAKRILSAANRLSASLKHAAISPAHIVLASLQAQDDLTALCGLSFARARIILGARAADQTPPGQRHVPADESLLHFLEQLPEEAESLGLLAQFLAGSTPELAQILTRHKVSAALVARSSSVFRDPERP